MILPNNNPLPRSHVNTSQLAAATDKLFSQTEQIIEKASKFEDEMRATITEMRQMMVLQQEKIEALEFQLTLKASITFGEQYPDLFNMTPEPARDDDIVYSVQEEEVSTWCEPRALAFAELCRKTIEEEAKDDADLDAVLEAHIQQRPVERDFDAEVDALLDAPLPVSMTRCMSYSAPQSAPAFARGITFYDPMQTVKHQRSLTRQMSAFQPQEEEEDAMSIPTMTRQSSVSVYSEEDECIFSNRQKQRRSPIISQAQVQVAPSKSLSLGEIVAENLNRAIGSRDLCGNL
jgi:hypothetical protein